MSTEQPYRRFSGVTRHGKKWLAKFRHEGRDFNLGHYDDPEQAARVADFARYMCFGLNPVNWHPNVGRPNFPPCPMTGIPDYVQILSKLPGINLKRFRAYNAAVRQNATHEILQIPASAE